jgi:predicted phosphohydrolase
MVGNLEENIKGNIMENKKGQIFVCGDFHGDANTVSSSKFPEGKTLTKDDVVIQMGDFGLYFYDPQDDSDIYWLDWLSEKPFTFAFFRGNHDNAQLIKKNVKWIKKWGNDVGEIQRKHGKIYYLPGGVYEINNKKILVVPGAVSHDRHMRTEGVNYWRDETLSRDETEKILDDLDKVNWKVDFMLSHTPGAGVQHHFYNGYPNHDSVAQFIDFIQERLEFNYSFFGHMHNEKVFVNEFLNENQEKQIEYHQCSFKNVINVNEYMEYFKILSEDEDERT